MVQTATSQSVRLKSRTTIFENTTVRQLINTIVETEFRDLVFMEGAKDAKVFTFFKGGFHTMPPSGKQ